MQLLRQFHCALVLVGFLYTGCATAADILNASYDVSRELFDAVNPAFVSEWQKQNGGQVKVRQSHAGSSKQARAVAEGLPADVVTFNQVTDIELLRRNGLVGPDWRQRFPHGASPYYSLPVLLTREGNPKKIRDWADLVRADVQVVFPNPKTSGNGRYTYLAAYAYALHRFSGDERSAADFVTRLLANVPVFDTGGRGSTTTFVERGIGDVLVTFESEINAIRREYGRSKLHMVTPTMSLRADFPIAVVDRVVDKKGTRAVATAYLQFLFSPQGQEIIARNYNRVHDPAAAEKYRSFFPAVKLVSVEETFGSWEALERKHFAAGGVLDQALLKAPAR